MNARHPEMSRSRAPRIVAAIAAIAMTAWLFDFVAGMGDTTATTMSAQSATTMVAQATTTIAR